MTDSTVDLRRGRDLLGLPVYSIVEGRRLGEIDALLVRREDRSIGAVRIRRGTLGQQHQILPFSILRTVGEDIALVESESALHGDAAAETEGLDMGLTGRPVLTQSGERVGQLAGFGVDTASGKIAVLRIRPDAGFMRHLTALVKDDTVELPGESVHSLGADAVIVLDEAAAGLRQPPAEPQ